MNSFQEIAFPKDSEYTSDGKHIPLEFYLDIFPASRIIYLKLGYFSSKAIQVLAYGFAQFIANGGQVKIITNHFLYSNDVALLDEVEIANTNSNCRTYLDDIEWIGGQLNGNAEHVINCLKLLVKYDRLEIVPVMLKPKRMAHYKQGIFIDAISNVSAKESGCIVFSSNLSNCMLHVPR